MYANLFAQDQHVKFYSNKSELFTKARKLRYNPKMHKLPYEML